MFFSEKNSKVALWAKRLVCCFLLLMGGASIRADFKIVGGMSLSWFNEEGTGWKVKSGLTGGIGIEFDLSYRTLLEFDLLFLQKGGLIETSGSREKYAINAGSVPVLIRSKLLHGTSPYFVGGLEISSILSYKSLKENGESIDLKGTINTLDYGLVAGAGFEFELEKELFLFVEIRYHHGLRNIFNTSLEAQERKTSAVVLLIGIRS